MDRLQITPINLGLMTADLAFWFALPEGHQYAGVENVPTQFFLIRLPKRMVLVDAPAYNFPEGDSPLLPEFNGRTAAGLLTLEGVPPESITDVILTHPHLDHTLGLVAEHTEIPAFPNARHYLGKQDWENMPNMDEVERKPLNVIEKAGLLTLVDGPLNLGDGLMLLPTPGETPSHQIVHLKNDEGEAYMIGDLFHHPLEFAEPERCPIWADVETMRASKVAFMQRAAENGAKVYFAHIQGAWTVDTRSQPPTWTQSQR